MEQQQHHSPFSPPLNSIEVSSTTSMSSVSGSEARVSGKGKARRIHGSKGYSLESPSQLFFDHEIAEREKEETRQTGKSRGKNSGNVITHFKKNGNRIGTSGVRSVTGSFVAVTLHSEKYTAKVYKVPSDGDPATFCLTELEYPNWITKPLKAVTLDVENWVKGLLINQLRAQIKHFWELVEPDWSLIFKETSTATRQERQFVHYFFTSPPSFHTVESQEAFDGLEDKKKAWFEVGQERSLLYRRIEPDKVVFFCPEEVCNRPSNIPMEEFDYMVVYRRTICHRIEYILRKVNLVSITPTKLMTDFILCGGDGRVSGTTSLRKAGGEDHSTNASLTSHMSTIEKHPPFTRFAIFTEMYWIVQDLFYHQIDQQLNIKAGRQGTGGEYEVMGNANQLKSFPLKKNITYHGDRPYHAWWVHQFELATKRAFNTNWKRHLLDPNKPTPIRTVGTRGTPATGAAAAKIPAPPTAKQSDLFASKEKNKTTSKTTAAASAKQAKAAEMKARKEDQQAQLQAKAAEEEVSLDRWLLDRW
jgi:hypothetical protein